MNRLIGSAALWGAVAVVAATAALASPPDPSHSTLQGAYIDVAGSTAGQPDNCSDNRCNTYGATIRDFANVPMVGASVLIDFSNCPDIRISCDQLTAVTRQTVVADKMVVLTTNALGQVTFRIQGAADATPPTANTTSPGTHAGVPCATVYADGMPLGSLIVAAYDVNGLGSPTAAVNVADISLVAREAALSVLDSANARARDDYNHSGTVSSVDGYYASLMAAQQIVGTGSQNTAPFCP